MDAQTIIGVCNTWPPQTVTDRLNNLCLPVTSSSSGGSPESRLTSELAAAMPPCTEHSFVTELCFGKHSGLATVLVARLYPQIPRLLTALSHTHACNNLYLHISDLKKSFADRYEVVQFEALKFKHMTQRSRDILPRVKAQSLIICTSFLQSLVEIHRVLDHSAVEAAMRWLCRRTFKKLENGGFLIISDERHVLSCFETSKILRESNFSHVSVQWVEGGRFILRGRRPNNWRQQPDQEKHIPNLALDIIKNSIIDIEAHEPGIKHIIDKENSANEITSESNASGDEDAEVEVEISTSDDDDVNSTKNSREGSKATKEVSVEVQVETSDEDDDNVALTKDRNVPIRRKHSQASDIESEEMAVEVQEDSSDAEVDEEVAKRNAEKARAMAEWARQHAQDQADEKYKKAMEEKQQQNSQEAELEQIYDALTAFYEDIKVEKSLPVLKQISKKFLGKRDKLFEFMRRKYKDSEPFVFRRLHENLDPDDERRAEDL